MRHIIKDHVLRPWLLIPYAEWTFILFPVDAVFCTGEINKPCFPVPLGFCPVVYSIWNFISLFFGPGYPSRHLPNYIFSLRLFRYQQNTFLLWEEPITLSLGLKTSVCSHPLYRNYCSIFHFFLHPRHGFVFPWHLKRFSIISFLV